MDAVNAQSEWDEAMARVLAFLSALRIGGVEQRIRVALAVLEEAKRRRAEGSERGPVEVAMDVAADLLDRWFAAGVVALEVTDAAQRFPNTLLSGDPSEELKAMLASVSVRTGPDLAISSMTPRPMDYGATETIAQETWHRFAWAPILRAAGLWTAIFFIALYAQNRFFPQ